MNVYFLIFIWNIQILSQIVIDTITTENFDCLIIFSLKVQEEIKMNKDFFCYSFDIKKFINPKII